MADAKDIAVEEKVNENQNQVSNPANETIVPPEWLDRLKKVAQHNVVPTKSWEERLAELAMDSLAYQILGLEGAARRELALKLYQAGSLTFLSRASVLEVADILKGQNSSSKAKADMSANGQAANTTKTETENLANAKAYGQQPPKVKAPAPVQKEVQKPVTSQPKLPAVFRKPAPDPLAGVPQHLRRLATIVETLSGVNPFKPDGSWLELARCDFDTVVARMTGGLNSIEVCERLGVDKLVTEACERYKLGVLPGEKGLSAALLIVAEFVIERQNRELHPGSQLTLAGGVTNKNDTASPGHEPEQSEVAAAQVMAQAS